jgi:DNA-binding transcriptional MerR regulator
VQKGRGASSGSTTGSRSSRKSSVSSRAKGRVEAGSGVNATERTRSTRKAATPSEEQARRTLAESPKLYYRIGEVSELTGVKAHVLRYWETEFRWMAPPKSRSKQRLYRKRDIEFVWLLKKLLWEQRFTIAGARQRIQELGLEEALARNADVESGESFFAAADAGSGLATDPSEGPLSRSALQAGRDAVEGAGPAAGDWLGIRIALDAMQSELLSLRGALQQGV